MPLTPVQLARLLARLNQASVRQTDIPLYEVVKLLINALNDINAVAGSISNSGSGTAGANGRDGIPAFLLSDSVSGSEDNSITGLVIGPQGNPGIAGSNGIQGVIGPTVLVENGLDGLDGFPTGVPGPQGNPGINGTAAGLISTTQLTNDQIAGLSTTPFTLVTGIASKALIPIFFSIVVSKTGSAWTNGNTGFYLAYETHSGTSIIANGGTVGLALASGGTIQSFAHVPVNVTNTANLALTGKGLQLVTLSDLVAGSGGPTTMNLIVIYVIQDPALF